MKGSGSMSGLRGMRDRALERLKRYLDRRTPRQRLRIVVVAFVLFAALDL